MILYASNIIYQMSWTAKPLKLDSWIDSNKENWTFSKCSYIRTLDYSQKRRQKVASHTPCSNGDSINLFWKLETKLLSNRKSAAAFWKDKITVSAKAKQSSIMTNENNAFRSMINAKLSQQSFWHCRDKKLIKKIPTIQAILSSSLISIALAWGLS